MLLHLTAIHSENNCPAYHEETVSRLMQSLERREDLARQYNIRLHYMVSAAPEHAFYMLLETDNVAKVSKFVMELLLVPHDFKLTIVQPIEDLVGTWNPASK